MKTVSYLKYVFIPFFKRNVNVIFKLKIYFASTRQPGKLPKAGELEKFLSNFTN